MTHKCMEFRTFIDFIGEDEALSVLSSFSVSRNPDVEKFLHKDAIAYEKSHNARTYLIIDKNLCVLGYFSLALSLIDVPANISKTMIKKLRGYGRYSADIIPCCLIGQLARNDSANPDDLKLEDFLKRIGEYAMKVKDLVGGRFLLVECIDELVSLYEKYDFIKISKKGNLNQLVLFLE